MDNIAKFTSFDTQYRKSTGKTPSKSFKNGGSRPKQTEILLSVNKMPV